MRVATTPIVLNRLAVFTLAAASCFAGCAREAHKNATTDDSQDAVAQQPSGQPVTGGETQTDTSGTNPSQVVDPSLEDLYADDPTALNDTSTTGEDDLTIVDPSTDVPGSAVVPDSTLNPNSLTSLLGGGAVPGGTVPIPGSLPGGINPATLMTMLPTLLQGGSGGASAMMSMLGPLLMSGAQSILGP